EIDRSAVLRYKQKRLKAAGQDSNSVLCEGNYLELDWESMLDAEKPTYIIWEGNTMYLWRCDVDAMLKRMRCFFKTFWVSFDFYDVATIKKQTGVPELTNIALNFERMGAPWLTGFDDV
ncbi:MAG: hypothetical protein CUN55_20550, partial [Phototrophicales bacterium]